MCTTRISAIAECRAWRPAICSSAEATFFPERGCAAASAKASRNQIFMRHLASRSSVSLAIQILSRSRMTPTRRECSNRFSRGSTPWMRFTLTISFTIESTPTPPCTQYINIDKSMAQGAELTVQARPTARLQVRGAYVYDSTQNLTGATGRITLAAPSEALRQRSGQLHAAEIRGDFSRHVPRAPARLGFLFSRCR